MIYLKKIDWDNFDEFMKLEVRDDQKTFVATVASSLSQAYVYLTNDDFSPFALAIYHDDQLIGHTLIIYKRKEENIYGNDDSYVIRRFMIDKRFQGRGYGSKALAKIITFIKSFPYGIVDSVYLSYHPKNIVAINLYNKYSFYDTGRKLDNGEVIARLDLSKKE